MVGVLVQALVSLIFLNLLDLSASEKSISLNIHISAPSQAEATALPDSEGVGHDLVQIDIEAVVEWQRQNEGAPCDS